MRDFLLCLFVYLPAFWFYFIIGFYIWTKACEKKNRELHEKDGK